MITQEIEEILEPTTLVQFYGFVPEKTAAEYDWYLCPFHKDKHASMRVFHEPGRGFYCHACGAGGGVVKFVERYFDLSNKDACLKIIRDFNLNILDKSKRKTSSVLDKIKRCKAQAVPLGEFLDILKREAFKRIDNLGFPEYKKICQYDFLVKKYTDPKLRGSNENIIKDVVGAYYFAQKYGYEQWKKRRKEFLKTIYGD